MPKRAVTPKTSRAKIEDLQRRMEEAEETLRAIREGQVDALIVAGAQGEQVYTLKGADHTFRVTVETMNEGAVTLSAQGHILYCNRRFADLVQVPLERVQGALFNHFVFPSDRPLFNALLEQGLVASAKGQVQLRTANGKQIPVYLSLATLGLEAAPSATMIVTDLTEQKRTEEILASERLARAIIDQAAEAIVVCDALGYVIRASRAAIQLCGQNPLHRHFDEVFPLEEDSSAEKERSGVLGGLISRPLNGEPLTNLEAELARPDGDRVCLMVNAGPLLDAENRIIGCTVALTDITERRRIEQELQQLNIDLQARTSAYEDANQGLAAANEEITVTLEELHTANEQLASANNQLETTNEELHSEIAERQHMEAEREDLLRRAQAAHAIAQAAVELRDRFIVVAAHELRNPLTSIQGYSELLAQRAAEAGLNPQFRRMADVIYHQSGRLENLISRMLDLSRIEQGQLALELSQVDLSNLIATVIRDVQSTAREHQIAFTSPGDPVIIQGDQARLEQVLHNLIQNAVKYSPQGGPVTVQLRQEPGRVSVTVADQGIGIPRSAQGRLFTQFYRAENTATHHIPGLGIGLYVSHEIVRLHGGDIEVESEEGKGSTFTVWLPSP